MHGRALDGVVASIFQACTPYVRWRFLIFLSAMTKSKSVKNESGEFRGGGGGKARPVSVRASVQRSLCSLVDVHLPCNMAAVSNGFVRVDVIYFA